MSVRLVCFTAVSSVRQTRNRPTKSCGFCSPSARERQLDLQRRSSSSGSSSSSSSNSFEKTRRSPFRRGWRRILGVRLKRGRSGGRLLPFLDHRGCRKRTRTRRRAKKTRPSKTRRMGETSRNIENVWRVLGREVFGNLSSLPIPAVRIPRISGCSKATRRRRRLRESRRAVLGRSYDTETGRVSRVFWLMMIFFLNYRYHQRGDTFALRTCRTTTISIAISLTFLRNGDGDAHRGGWKQMFRNLTNFSMIKYDLKIYYRQKGSVDLHV